MEQVSSSIQLPSSPTQCSDPIEKLFNWDSTKPRPISEYINRDFSKPFNIVAPELREIGGLGQVRCVRKNRRQALVNRPTQVQKISHTTTKLLPNFSLTNEMKPVACDEKKKLSIHKHVEKVKFAENLPDIGKKLLRSAVIKTKEFNHENPLNLDLTALNDYQRQKSEVESAMRQRRFQIVRRIMETKKLKTKGAEEILQEERDEKFKLPAFFDIAKSSSRECEKETTIMRKIDEDETESSNTSFHCATVSVVDKPKNREIIKLHYQHKRDKLRQLLLAKKATDEAAQKAMQQCKQLEEENLIFHLADESLQSSEADKIRKASFHFDGNQINDFEFSHRVVDDDDDSIECGHRIGNEVVLRSFHDRLFSEPRGRDNLHIVLNGDCKMNQELLPNVKKQLPKGKLFSSLKDACDPNDDKTLLFTNDMKKNVAPQSAIRNHIQQIDLKMKKRNCKSKVKKMRAIDAKETQRRYRRMSFMGIPIGENKIERIVNEISRNSALLARLEDKSTSKDKHLNAKIAPEGIKLMPTIPAFVKMQSKEDVDGGGGNGGEEIENECEQSKVVPAFVNAKPRGSDPEMLRIDKSLPWIQHDINTTRAKLQKDSAASEEKLCNKMLDNEDDDDAHVQCNKKKIADENQSELKRRYNDIIAIKRCNYYNCTINNSVNELKNDDSKSESEMQSMQSASTLSSVGTNFSNDSGSCIVVENEKIPKSRLNIGRKFQNKSLLTTEPQTKLETQPYFNGNITIMRQLLKPSDRFHTQRTRSDANIRQRVKVKSTDYEDELIGYKSQLATDIDESYIKEFYQERSHTEFRFRRVSEIIKLRESLRKKFETYYIKEKLLFDQMSAKKYAQEMQKVSNTVNEYEEFLETQKQLAHRKTKRKIEQVKDYYVATDKLRAEYNELHVQLEPMKMKIFLLGFDFVQRVKLRDFQYLLMPIDWRLRHDHLHQDASGNLEDYRTSIESREVRNLWDRSCATVDTIMSYINDAHEKLKREHLKTFTNSDEFMAMYKNLESKSFKALAKFTYASMGFYKIENECAIFEVKSRETIERYESAVSALRNRWKFSSDRLNMLKNRVQVIMDKTLHESFSTPLCNNLTVVTDILYKKLVCKTNCGNAKHFTNVEKFAGVEEKVLEIFEKLDKIPKKLRVQIEKDIRQKRKKKLKIAEKARRIELNIEDTMKQVERLFAKPAKKEKRVGKLPRSVLAKKKPKELKKPPVLSSLEEEYAMAFSDFTGEDKSNVKDVKDLIKKIKNDTTPFYIDRFVESLGYTINKLTPLDTENIIKDEVKNMKFPDLLPNVKKQVNFSEILREKIKNENIQKTLYLYEQIKK